MNIKPYILPLFLFLLSGLCFYVSFNGLFSFPSVLVVFSWLLNIVVGSILFVFGCIFALYGLLTLFIQEQKSRFYLLLGSVLAVVAVVAFFVPQIVPFFGQVGGTILAVLPTVGALVSTFKGLGTKTENVIGF